MKLNDGTELKLPHLFNGDCLELMKKLPDNCIDLVLTDPPYGIGADKGVGGGSKRGAVKKFSGDWDSKIPDKNFFDEMLRISKYQIVWGGNYFTEHIYPVSSWLIWDKREGLPERTFADCEMAWTNFNSPARIFRHKWDGMIQENMKNKEERIHPTQKPLKLFKWCLEKYAMPIIEKQGIKPKDFIVADFFGGSFTAALACEDYGFSYIIAEKDKDYFVDGSARLKNHTKQLRLDF